MLQLPTLWELAQESDWELGVDVSVPRGRDERSNVTQLPPSRSSPGHAGNSPISTDPASTTHVCSIQTHMRSSALGIAATAGMLATTTAATLIWIIATDPVALAQLAASGNPWTVMVTIANRVLSVLW